MKATRICLVLDNVHMGWGHDALAALAAKFHKPVDKLEQGDLILFLNRKKDKLKLMGNAGRVIGYLRLPAGNHIMMEALQFIPHTFGGNGFSYDAALRKALELKIQHVDRPSKAGPLKAYQAMRSAGL